jgi:hypothetical protein
MRARAAFATVVLLAAIGCSKPPPDPYAAYRQTITEHVPGTLDWQLQPIEADDFRAQVGPAQAYQELFTAGERANAIAILAQVGNLTDHSLGPPAWVFVTPRTCYATAKGDLVSPGRTGNGCTQDNLYVQGVDATTGQRLGGFSAYDTPEGWAPSREGTPAVVLATTQAGTTRLH